ncbi:hypothetical protein [Helicobacter bizzozeronii]|uniref:hypothetical protein n=1 Tax=Helicobacter bizzozeronii TaxID=56877 RepID=UPI000CEE7237|nr:hypothetical protein [Helicobacter bizzozeronii]
MPLPLIIGGLALAAVAGVVIISIREFFNRVEQAKKNKRATGAKIKSLKESGNYTEVDLGLLRDRDEIASETYQINKEEAKQLREGMTL